MTEVSLVRYEDVNDMTTEEYFNGNQFSIDAFNKKYALYEGETYIQALKRVCDFIASCEDTDEKRKYWSERWFDEVFNQWWHPAGSIMQGANSGKSISLSNCCTISLGADDFENELLDLSVKLTGIPANEIHKALNLALTRIGSFLSADRAYIFEIDSNIDTMSNTYEWCSEGVMPQIDNLQNLPCDIFPMWIETLRQNENIVIPAVHLLPDSWKAEREILEMQEIESLVVIPILIDNQLVGFVGLDGIVKKKEIYDSEIKMFRVWSNLLASLIKNQKMALILKQTHENYDTFFNSIGDFLFVLDEKGNILHTNSTVTDRLGYSENEIAGKNMLMVHPPELSEEAARIVGEMIEGKTDACYIPLLTKSGRYIPVETRVTNGFWDTKPALFGVTKDITKLKLSEEKFAKVFYLNPSACGLSDLETGRYLEVNETFTQLLGFTQEETVGKTAVDLGLMSVETMADLRSRISGGEKIVNLEAKLKAKNGDIKYVLLSAENILIQDRLHRFTVVHDVTERKKAAEALIISEHNLAEAQRIAHIGSWELMDSTNEFSWSDETFRIFGYEPGSVKPNMELFLERIYPEDLSLLMDAITDARVFRQPFSLEHRIILPDGQINMVHENVELMYDEIGQAGKWLGTVQDITDRKKIEDKLQDSLLKHQSLIEHIENVRENERVAISRELHDDLGQALTAVKIDLEIIKQSKSIGDVMVKVNKVSSLVSKTIKTVQRLTYQLRPDIINDLGLPAAIEWYAKDFAVRNNIEVEVKLYPMIDISNTASLHIFRIFQESLTNIARHARASQVLVHLYKTVDSINFRISDNGTGINEKKIKSRKSFGLLSMQERTVFRESP